jgi:hypothetical protein
MTLVGYLKKQSQFFGGRIGVKSYLKGNYGNISTCGRRKTKPIRRLGKMCLKDALFVVF